MGNMYKVTDGGDGSVYTANEQDLRDIASYYYHNSEVIEPMDFDKLPLQESIRFIRRADKVELIPPRTEPMYNNFHQLTEMKTKLSEHVTKMLDDIDDGDYDEEKHNINVSFGGRTFSLDLHADLYESLTKFIDEQISAELEEM